MTSIGARLKSGREAKGIGLEEAVRVTKIQRRILEAMESDQLDEALEPAYAKIFLKKYASYLGIDGQALVGEYLSHHGGLPETPLGVKTQTSQRQAAPSFPKILIPVVLAVIAAIGIGFLVFLAADLAGNLAKPKKKARSAALSPPSRVIQAKTDGSPKPLIPRSQPLKLTIRAKGDVWMQVKADGAVIFQNVLSKGSQESWTAQKELELWTGNAAVTELFLNGKALGTPGSGVRRGIKITHWGLEGPQ